MEQRINELRQRLNELNKAYYEDDAPLVSDEEYDRMMVELIKLEEEYPEFYSPDSPSQKVGGRPNKKFQPITHERQLLSLGDVFSFDELLSFGNRVVKDLGYMPTFVYEWKIDGLSVALTYDNGKLQYGATRGDGLIGEDVTENLCTIKEIPKEIPFKGHLVCRGEVYMPKSSFAELNAKREEEGQPLFANPRNAAAGSLRQLDSAVTASRGLSYFIYDLYGSDELPQSQQGIFGFLKKQGFSVNGDFGVITDIKVMEDILYTKAEERHSLPYDVDGLVVKVDDFADRTKLGTTSKVPKYAIAYKFPAEKQKTKLLDIKIMLGRTGALTPLGVLEPVLVAGSVISKVSLHNEDYIKEKDIRIGDMVLIQKAGDVIPEVVCSLPKERKGELPIFEFPHYCPVCNGEAVRLPEEAVWRCVNDSCPGRLLENMKHFVSKNAMDIDGLGPSLIKNLAENGLIHDVADLYYLQEEDILPLENMGQKSASNLVNALNESKKAGLARVLFALGIRHIGSVTGEKLAVHFQTMDNILAVLDDEDSFEELKSIDEIGPIIAESMIAYFSSPQNRALVQKLAEAGVDMQAKEQRNSGVLEDKTFLFTGTLSMPRNDAQKIVKENGGRILSAVSKNLDYLVVGEKAGSKLKKAQDLGVAILTEDEFLALIGADHE